jgi:Domain of unknown function (DUF4421)
VVQAAESWRPENNQTLHLKGGIETPNLEFSLKGPGADAIFRPNNPSSLFLATAYRRVGLSVQWAQKPDDRSVRERGHSDVRDIQLRWFGHRTSHELVYQHFHGYAMDQWKDPNTGGAWLRPDLAMTYFGVNVFRALSPRWHSMAIAYDQRGVQFRRAGSLFVFASGARTRLDGASPLIPEGVFTRGSVSDLERFTVHSGLLGIGYGYLWPIYSRFYFAAGAFFGAGFGYQQLRTSKETLFVVDDVRRFGLRAGLGHNYGNHMAGFQLIVDSTTHNMMDGEIDSSTQLFRLFYGYRFQTMPIPLLDRAIDRWL